MSGLTARFFRIAAIAVQQLWSIPNTKIMLVLLHDFDPKV